MGGFLSIPTRGPGPLVPIKGCGQLIGDIGWRVIVQPGSERGVLVIGGDQIVGGGDRRLRQSVDGHGLLSTPIQSVDEGVKRIPAVGAVTVVSDLPTWVLRCGHIQVVGQTSPGELGVTGLLEEAVATEAEGVVHGDPLGAEDGEGVAEAGRALDVGLGRTACRPSSSSTTRSVHRAGFRSGRCLLLAGHDNVTLHSSNVTLPGHNALFTRRDGSATPTTVAKVPLRILTLPLRPLILAPSRAGSARR